MFPTLCVSGFALLAYLVLPQQTAAQAAAAPEDAAAPQDRNTSSPSCYLFSYFVGKGEEGLHLAWSRDGYQWEALNGGKSLLAPQVGESKLMRDPCLLYGPDGTFHLVWTTSWNGKSIGYASSPDLIHWSEQRAIPVMAHEPGALNCWAPEIVFDDMRQQYLIFWSTTIPGRFPATDGAGDAKYNHRIYATTTRNFKEFTPTRLFYDGGFNVIDATLLPAEGRYYLIVKDETLNPVTKHLRIASGDSPEGPFTDISSAFTPDWVEGPSAMRLDGFYVVLYDIYREGRYGAVRSRDLKRWEDASSLFHLPPGARHGTVLKVPQSIVTRLRDSLSVRSDPQRPPRIDTGAK